MKKYLILLLFLGFIEAQAQELDTAKRHSFAKSYIGLEFNYFSGLKNSSYLDENGRLQTLNRSNSFTPAINIGATHFWGHADFFVSIATASFKTHSDEIENSIRIGAITGMRIYPSAIDNGKLKPYLSYKFTPIRLIQENIEGEQFQRTKVKSIFGGGLTYQLPKMYAYIGYEFVSNHEALVHISRNQTASSSFPRGVLSFSVNYSFDSTVGTYSKPVAKLDSFLANTNSHGFFLGLGPSSAFPVISSSYIENDYPFLDDKAMPKVFPEFSIGYHFNKKDIKAVINYRSMVQRRNAFSFKQTINRRSIGVEANKFLFDFHGFAPFVGLGVAKEAISLKERDGNSRITNSNYNFITPIISFGWDIRPSRKADIWLLRTNLRYSPFLKIEKNNKNISLQHLEFNFIQLIVYPQRIQKLQDFL